MTPAEVARAEGRDEAAIHALLEQEGFRGLVASYRALAERSAAEQTARLVKLARFAIENALSDWDVGAALFVLRENARGLDPAETVARGVVAASRRNIEAAAAALPTAPPRPAPEASATRPHDPGLRLLERGAARLRRGLIEEHAVRHAAEAATDPADAATTVAAARKALALKAAATARPSAYPLARLTRRLVGEAGITSLRPVPVDEVKHPAVAGRPRRPRPP